MKSRIRLAYLKKKWIVLACFLQLRAHIKLTYLFTTADFVRTRFSRRNNKKYTEIWFIRFQIIKIAIDRFRGKICTFDEIASNNVECMTKSIQPIKNLFWIFFSVWQLYFAIYTVFYCGRALRHDEIEKKKLNWIQFKLICRNAFHSFDDCNAREKQPTQILSQIKMGNNTNMILSHLYAYLYEFADELLDENFLCTLSNNLRYWRWREKKRNKCRFLFEL